MIDRIGASRVPPQDEQSEGTAPAAAPEGKVVRGSTPRNALSPAARAQAAATPAPAPGAAGLLKALKATFKDHEQLRSPGGRKLDPRSRAVRDALPAAVRASYDYYYKHVESNDWGSVRLAKRQLAGETVYLTTVTTDGDDGYLEAFRADGTPIGSAMLSEVDGAQWDARFGAIRKKVIY